VLDDRRWEAMSAIGEERHAPNVTHVVPTVPYRDNVPRLRLAHSATADGRP
jgi:hypothetical protein